jgi:formate hydrogenlyase subunit 3/multisubunit Na+/H+ antiporter MnhD subunit
VPVITFDVLQSVALFIIVVALLASLFSRSLHRMKTWFCLLVSFVIYCVSFLLLAGLQNGLEPPVGLCLFQAGLVYAAPPL